MKPGAYMRGVIADTGDYFSDCTVTLSPPPGESSGVSPLTPGGVVALRLLVAANAGEDFVILTNDDGVQGSIRADTGIDVDGEPATVSASWKRGSGLYARLAAPLAANHAAGSAVTITATATIVVPGELLSSRSLPATAEAQDIAWGASVARQSLTVLPEVGWTISRTSEAGEARSSTVADVQNMDTEVFVWAGRKVGR